MMDASNHDEPPGWDGPRVRHPCTVRPMCRTRRLYQGLLIARTTPHFIPDEQPHLRIPHWTLPRGHCRVSPFCTPLGLPFPNMKPPRPPSLDTLHHQLQRTVRGPPSDRHWRPTRNKRRKKWFYIFLDISVWLKALRLAWGLEAGVVRDAAK